MPLSLSFLLSRCLSVCHQTEREEVNHHHPHPPKHLKLLPPSSYLICIIYLPFFFFFFHSFVSATFGIRSSTSASISNSSVFESLLLDHILQLSDLGLPIFSNQLYSDQDGKMRGIEIQKYVKVSQVVLIYFHAIVSNSH